MKIVLTIVLVLVLLVGGGLWWLGSNLDGLVRDGVERHAPRYLGTEVRLDGVDLAPFSGRGALTGLQVANPTGFPEGNAFELGEVRLAIDLATVGDPVVVIDEVVLDGARVLLDQQGRNTNLQRLLANVEQAAGAPSDPAAGDAGPRIIVERFVLTNTSARVRSDVLGERSVDLPDLELTGLGREGEGATPAEVLRQVMQPLARSLTDAVARLGVEAGRERVEELVSKELQDRLGEAEGAQVLEGLKNVLPFGRSRDEQRQGDG